MKQIVAAIFLVLVSTCAFADGVEYTLYRTGIDMSIQNHDETLRIHIATFDAVPFKSIEDNAKYNRANCEFAQELFSLDQPHHRGSVFKNIKIKYWCEKGQFNK